MNNSTQGSSPVVLHLAPGYYAGDARLFHQECFSLKKAGYSVGFVAHPKSKEEFLAEQNFYSLGLREQSSWRLRVGERLRRSYKAYSLARESQASLFHVHSPEFIPWGIYLKWKLNRPLIFDIREDYEGYVLQRPGIPPSLRGTLAFLVKKQLQWAARNCDALILADEGTADGLRQHARRTLVLHNFPRLDLFPFEEVPEDKKLHDIVCHGTMLRTQIDLCLGIDDALVAKGCRVRWRLISTGAPDMEWFIEEVVKRNARERFTIDERIPHDKIAGEVRKARIGISLFTNERKFQKNIPRKIFEFMALGMPMVLADLPSTKPFIRNGIDAVAVTPDDCNAFADAISRLLSDSSLRRQMGQEGRKAIEREYNWEQESRKLLSLYSELLRQ